MAEFEAVHYEFLVYMPGNPNVPTNIPGPLDPHTFNFVADYPLMASPSLSGPGGPGASPSLGGVFGGYTDWFLNRVWITPRPIDYGNIISERTITMTMLSTFEPPKLLRLVSIDTGALDTVQVEITSGDARPAPLQFLRQVEYDFTALAQGVPNFDLHVDFVFDGE